MKWFGLVLLQLLAKTVCSSDSNPDGEPLNIYDSVYEYLFSLGNVSFRLFGSCKWEQVTSVTYRGLKEILYLRPFILIWRTALLIAIP